VAIAVTALRLVGADVGVELARDMGLFVVMGWGDFGVSGTASPRREIPVRASLPRLHGRLLASALALGGSVP
jgi:hypothetical protein